MRFLRRMDENESVTFKELVQDYHALKTIKEDAKLLEHPTDIHHNVRAVKEHRHQRSRPSHNMHKRGPPSPCPLCGENHWKSDCPTRTRPAPSQRVHHKSGTATRWNTTHRRHKISSIASLEDNSQRFIHVKIGEHETKLQLDTGADITLISRHTWKKLGCPPLSPTTDEYKVANGEPLQIDGQFETPFAIVDDANRVYHGHGVCHVIQSNDLLGFPWIEHLPDFQGFVKKFMIQTIQQDELITQRRSLVEHLKEQFPTVFKTDLGCCTKTKATLQIKPGKQPIFKGKRPVPFAAKAVIEDELERLQQLGVITPVNHS